MAKRVIKEKDVKEFLLTAGFKEVNESDKASSWYKKAAKQPSCLKNASTSKIKR